MKQKSQGDRIRRTALNILESRPEGVKFADLQRAIKAEDDSLNLNSIAGAIFNLQEVFKRKVEKPSRGLFRLSKFSKMEEEESRRGAAPVPKEESFYLPFADWIKSELEDVTEAISLGGSKFRDKWGTPDVIGKRVSKPSDIIQSPVEIVSAEIKTDTNQLVTAFGQSCAYCLFSHKSYLVIPKKAMPEEISRLDSLCQIFGIGLVLFNATNADDPGFEIRVRPRKQDPDLYYTNKYMKEIESELFRT